jgi:predicted nuclease of predicted toxin-antitoxin system
VPEFLVDENLPRSLAPRLRAAGFAVEDIRDLGLRGAPDTEIFQFALSRGLVLLTGDLGFGQLLRASPTCQGVILMRLPNDWPTSAVNDLIERSLPRLAGHLAPGTLVVLEPERVRMRRFL